jgi:ribA/ribD-fused uncharacterized protein
MEQYMMAEKARLFNDEEILEKIMKSKLPIIMQELGGTVRNFDENEWDKSKYAIIIKGSYAKFSQNENLRQFLIGTKEMVLVYEAPQDKIWGVGMYDDKCIENPLKWEGANLLGFALMEVRDILIEYNNLRS